MSAPFEITVLEGSGYFEATVRLRGDSPANVIARAYGPTDADAEQAARAELIARLPGYLALSRVSSEPVPEIEALFERKEPDHA